MFSKKFELFKIMIVNICLNHVVWKRNDVGVHLQTYKVEVSAKKIISNLSNYIILQLAHSHIK